MAKSIYIYHESINYVDALSYYNLMKGTN